MRYGPHSPTKVAGAQVSCCHCSSRLATDRVLAGLATLVGIITPVTAFLGADAAVHMSEELKDASKTLPRVMISTSIVNGALGFVMLM